MPLSELPTVQCLFRAPLPAHCPSSPGTRLGRPGRWERGRREEGKASVGTGAAVSAHGLVRVTWPCPAAGGGGWGGPRGPLATCHLTLSPGKEEQGARK